MGEYYNDHVHNNHHDHEDQEFEDDKEEALSLCDLPLTNNNSSNNNKDTLNTLISPRSSIETPEFFEFLSDIDNISSHMSTAEDLIFCGKLMPFKHHSPPNTKPHFEDTTNYLSFCGRSESLSGLSTYKRRRRRSNTVKRSSRSLDYQKLEMLSITDTSPEEEIDLNSTGKSTGKGDLAAKAVKPRWYVLMFGSVRPPLEMELRDIKRRQVHRNNIPFLLFPSEADTARKKQPEGVRKLLSALSCKSHASVAVATSYCLQ